MKCFLGSRVCSLIVCNTSGDCGRLGVCGKEGVVCRRWVGSDMGVWRGVYTNQLTTSSFSSCMVVVLDGQVSGKGHARELARTSPVKAKSLIPVFLVWVALWGREGDADDKSTSV